jgi:Rab proteins geranylgeranyltransferase component A
MVLDRTCAVSGGTYILGKDFKIDYIEETQAFQVHLDGIGETLSSRTIIAEPSQLPEALSTQPPASGKLVSRCIAIIDQPVRLVPSGPSPAEDTDQPNASTQIPEIDSSVLTFPPGILRNGTAQESVTAMITGEGSLSCPKGFCTCAPVLCSLVRLTVTHCRHQTSYTSPRSYHLTKHLRRS